MSEFQEIWKSIPGYGGHYEASNMGRNIDCHANFREDKAQFEDRYGRQEDLLDEAMGLLGGV